MEKHRGNGTETLKTVLSGLVFFIVIALSIWATAVSILPDEGMDSATFWPEFIKRAVLTVLLVSSGISFAYSMTRLIVSGVGARNYEKGTAKHTSAYKYMEARDEIIDSKSIIDKHGLLLELEESIDFINLERRATGYEELVDDKIRTLGKSMQNKKNKLDPALMKELKEEMIIAKTDKGTISKMKNSVTHFKLDDAQDADDVLYNVYGEPRYDVVYTRDVYTMKKNNLSWLGRVMNSSPVIFFKERVKPLATPLVFAALTTYYIVSFIASSNATALLITVGTTTLIAMFNAMITEITSKFDRELTKPHEENSYIFKRFKSKNKEVLTVLEDGTLSINEYHELQKVKMEALKKQMLSQYDPKPIPDKFKPKMDNDAIEEDLKEKDLTKKDKEKDLKDKV